MESNWTKAEFKTFGAFQGEPGNLMQLANQALARELSLNLSAFLRTAFTASYSQGSAVPYGDLSLSDSSSCFGLALLRPDQRKLIVEMENTVMYPLLGIALGAKAGSFASPERKPTEIELQIVQMLLRLVLTEACRAWSTLIKKPLETVTFEIERTPNRIWPVAEPVFVARFEISGEEEQLGSVRLIAPLDLFSGIAQEDAPAGQTVPSDAEVESTLEAMMSANASLAVWLDGSHMFLGDLLQLSEGQVVKLDHRVERGVSCTINGQKGFSGQIVSTGSRRAFLVEEYAS